MTPILVHLLNRVDSPPLPTSVNAARDVSIIQPSLGKLTYMHVAQPPLLNVVAGCSLVGSKLLILHAIVTLLSMVS